MGNEIQICYNVLLINNDKDRLIDDKELLKKYGYTAYTASDYESIINILKSANMEIVVLNYGIPNEIGQELILKIQKYDPNLIIILQVDSSQQIKLQTLISLNIYGYYDYNDERWKLLLWVMSATRSREQIKDINQIAQKIEIVHSTLNEVKRDQNSMLEQARLANLGKKMGSIFHDMANPIIGIRSAIEIIDLELSSIESYINQSPDYENVEKKAEEIISDIKYKCKSCLEKTKYMLEMKNTIVAQSRQECVTNWNIFSLKKLLNTVSFFAEDDVRKYKCVININNSVNPETKIAGKEISLAQALNNLITNSAQAYKSGGNIEIIITRIDNYITFAIKDWAGGIPLDVQAKLLNKTVTTKGAEGNGIGVYTAYLAVTDVLGGNMRFESVLGEGTTFYISIPCACY